MKLKLKEVKQVINEALKEQKLVEAKTSINKILLEKEGFLSNLARKVGMSDPSLDVDDPKHVKKTLDKTISNATKTSKEFQASSLNTTREINKFHDAIKNVLDQVSSLSDTLGADQAKEYQGKMIELAKDFYSLLKRESDRIDSYLKTIGSEIQAKGGKKQDLYKNISGLKKKSAQSPENDDIENTIDVDDDQEVEKLVGKKKPYRDDSAALFNDKDPKQVKDFLRGKSKVRA